MRSGDDHASRDPVILGAELPDGTRFIGRAPDAVAGWTVGRAAPSDEDLSTCVACGLCLPHCPTYRLTGAESASPRGRIAAMRAISEGTAEVDDTFARFMDLCLVCRACEDVCPSHAPFGRMMEGAREQIEPLRTRRSRFARWLGLDVALPRKKVLWLAALLQPLARPLLPARMRGLAPRPSARFSRLPAVTEPSGEPRGTVALLSGCVQDRWFRPVNLATIRVLAAQGYRVVVPRAQVCCGALHAHNGRLETARRLARRNVDAFRSTGVDRVLVNASGCGAHLQTYGELLDDPGSALPTDDVLRFLAREGFRRAPARTTDVPQIVAFHDPCHALRAQGIHDEPRELLSQIPGVEIREIEHGDRCCGAAGLYNVTEPELSGRLMREKAQAVAATGADAVASANPGCTMQLRAGLREIGGRAADIEVVHPIEILHRSLR